MSITGRLLLLLFLQPWTGNPITPYEQAAFITLASAIWVQVVCLCLLLVIRFVVIVAQAVDKPSRVVTKPFDFYAMTKDSDKPAIYTMVSGVTIRCVNLLSGNSQGSPPVQPRPALVCLASQTHLHHCHCAGPPRILVHQPRA